jgi:hypothetical protein
VLVQLRLERSRLFMLNIGHGMGAPEVGQYRVEDVRPTEVTVVAGTRGMDAHPTGRYRVETAHPIDLEGDATSFAKLPEL